MKKEYLPITIGSMLAVVGFVGLHAYVERTNRPEGYLGDPVVVEEGAEVLRARHSSHPCGTIAVAGTVRPEGVYGDPEQPESYVFNAADVRQLLADGSTCTARQLVIGANEITPVSIPAQGEG